MQEQKFQPSEPQSFQQELSPRIPGVPFLAANDDRREQAPGPRSTPDARSTKTQSLALRAARYAFKALGWLPLDVARGVGSAVGWALYTGRGRFFALTAQHIDLAYPDLAPAARQRLIRASIVNAACVVAEAPALWFGPQARLTAWLDASPEAASAMAGACAEGRGALLLCPHLGNWEAAGLFGSRFLPITNLYKPQNHDAGVGPTLMREGRERLGARLVPTTTGGVRKLLGALKAGEALGILPDHDPPEGSGVFAPLFGRPAHTMDLVGKLAARSGAPVRFVIGWRVKGGFRFETYTPEPGINSADPRVATAALNRTIEQLIALHPEQNWWAYKRYRRQPPGVASPYA